VCKRLRKCVKDWESVYKIEKVCKRLRKCAKVRKLTKMFPILCKMFVLELYKGCLMIRYEREKWDTIMNKYLIPFIKLWILKSSN